jgi:NitT/TauT family transport system permease protein
MSDVRSNSSSDLVDRFLSFIPVLAFTIAAIVIWQMVVVTFDLPPILLPSPLEVLKAGASEATTLLEGVWVTGLAAVCGFLASVVIGTIIAALMSQSKVLRLALFPYVILLQTVPIVAIAPLLVIWSGYEFRTVVLVTVIISLFPIVNSVAEGLMAIPQERIELFRLYGASRSQILWRLRVPTAVRYLMLGCKTSCGLAVIGAIVAEFFVGNGGANYEGLGTLMTGWQTLGRTAPLMAALFVSTLLGIAMFATVQIFSITLLKRWMSNE